jgi:hypothetical protein
MYRIPRKPQVTTASGSPPENFLTQSPRGAFTIGTVQKMGDVIWGYSGMVDWDITAAASYPLLRFTLEKNAMLSASFNCDWHLLDTSNNASGVAIAIDGIETVKVTWEQSSHSTGPWNSEFFLPAGRDCLISSLNPDAGADLLQANIVIRGQYV